MVPSGKLYSYSLWRFACKKYKRNRRVNFKRKNNRSRKTKTYNGGNKLAHVRKQQICFFLTVKCNLKCRYCYTLKIADVKKEHQTLNFNFAKRAIDDFFRDYPSREIRFYGAGEPTLEFELMKKIKEYAHSQAGDKLKVELQTNGFFSKKSSMDSGEYK